MVEVLVEFEYEARQDDELTIHPGDLICNVRKDLGGWWEGELRGRRGVFPDNFVKEVSRDEGTYQVCGVAGVSAGRMSTVGLAISGSGGAGKTGRKGRSGSRRKAAPFHRRAFSFFSSSDKSRRRQCEVVFSYAPQNEDELPLFAGDIIDITKEVEEGWWEGSLNGQTGVFPSNFVKEVTSSTNNDEREQENGEQTTPLVEPPSDTSDGSTKDSSAVEPSGGGGGGGGLEMHSKRIRGFGFGDIFKEGSVKLRTRISEGDSGEKDGKNDKPTTTQTASIRRKKPSSFVETDAPRPDLDKGRAKELCKALFPYAAQNEDELSLKEGDLVAIIAKDCGDAGWWEGEIQGRRGVFPDNFVKVISPEVDRERPKKPPPPAISNKPILSPKVDLPATDKKEQKTTTDTSTKAEVPEEKPREAIVRHPELPSKPCAPAIPPKPTASRGGSLSRGSATSSNKRGDRPSPGRTNDVRPDHISLGGSKAEDGDITEKTSDMPVGFETVVSSPEKLSHPTTQRPRHPGRRPPSQFPGNVMWEAGEPSPTDSSSPQPETPNSEPPESSVMNTPLNDNVDGSENRTRNSRIISDQRRSLKSPPGMLGGAVPVFPMGSHSKPEVLKKIGVEGGSVGLDEIRVQLQELKEHLDTLKSQHRRDIALLTNELEEEKKCRASLQVEVQKLKKQLQGK
uniref:SH3 domain-containing kinase-binding protein 1-like isoform X2 n=1 Tax=Myxine glutinosa TaxID=7769 RepID=UPI00358DDCED